MTNRDLRGNLIMHGRMMAAVFAMSDAGVSEFEMMFEDDFTVKGVPQPLQVLWRCKGKWGKANEELSGVSERYSYPAHAAEDLLSRVLNGSACLSCGRRVVVGLIAAGFCSRTLVTADLDNPDKYVYKRGCRYGL